MKIFTILTNKKAELSGVIVLLAIWQLGSLRSGNILLPSPLETFSNTLVILSDENFLTVVVHTVMRGLIGFVLSAFLGVLFGFSAGKIKFFEGFYNPLLNVIKATPVMSIIILLIIWFKTDTIPIVVSFLVGFPIVYGNVLAGTKNIDSRLIDMAKVYQVSYIRIFFQIYIPAITPYLFSGFNTAMSIGWKAVVAAEVLLQPRFSIGEQLMNAKSNLDFSLVFAWTLVAIVLSYIFDKMFRMMEKIMVRWY